MGAGNVNLAFTHWTHLDDRSFRVLCRMALVSMDNGNPPKCFAGRDDLASALGKGVPGKPDEADASAAAEAARRSRASTYEIVRKAVSKLMKEGVIVSSGDARFKNRAEYSLHLTPAGLPQETIAASPNDLLPQPPQQPQRFVAPMPQQNVAPLTQQIVATDPTDRCPLGVEEQSEEQLIGTNPGMTLESPEHPEAKQGEINIHRPAEKPTPSKAALAKQLEEDFQAWYAVYPKHQGKAAALQSYVKARKNGATAEDLTAGAERYAAERKGQEARFTKMPATWLNQGCWEDEYLPAEDPLERLKALYNAPVRAYRNEKPTTGQKMWNTMERAQALQARIDARQGLNAQPEDPWTQLQIQAPEAEGHR